MTAPETPDKDLDGDGHVSVAEEIRWWRRAWRAAPSPVRRSIAGVVGGTLIVLGLALVVLPGPFTLPLVAAGLAVLGSEFAWAHRALERGRQVAGRTAGRVMRRLPRRR